MPLIKFVHAADLHLDSPFQQIRNKAPDHVAAALHAATFDAWKNIVKLCITEEVHALLVAGDIYDGADRSLRAQRDFIDGLERLHDKGIRSFVCHGNHDPLDGWEAQLKYPDTCHRFDKEWETKHVFADDPQRAAVTVTGISYPTREVRENLIKKLEQRAPAPFQIGLLHANVGRDTGHASYAQCSVEDLAATGIDYWALGHVHTREIRRPADPTVIYPGNPQGRHPNERGPRGVYVVEVADDHSVHPRFEAVDVVRWEQIDLDISELQSEQDLLDELPRRVDQRLQDADNRSLVLRIDLHGRGLLHETLRRQGVVDDLREQINDLFQTREPFAWCERISDLTKPQIDLDALAAGADFTAELIKQSREVQADPAQLKELAAELKPLYDNQRFSFLRQERLGAEEPDPDEMASLLREAEAIVLDLLVEDES